MPGLGRLGNGLRLLRHGRLGNIRAAVVVEAWAAVIIMARAGLETAVVVMAGLEAALRRGFQSFYGVQNVSDALVEIGFSRENAGRKREQNRCRE